MHLGAKKQTEPGAVPLQSAVLCVDCECVTDGRSDACPVCGSRALLSVARIVGGTLLAQKGKRPEPETKNVLYDLEITVGLKLIGSKDLSDTVEGIAALIGPRLGRGRACCHIKVDPVVDLCNDADLAA